MYGTDLARAVWVYVCWNECYKKNVDSPIERGKTGENPMNERNICR